ncbi:MAG: hypothetical protein JW755_03345 [Candidatus Aminicenantes bacterium]|nr:hypothetical protein [Candidatus Aminicenantes bacterium]
MERGGLIRIAGRVGCDAAHGRRFHPALVVGGHENLAVQKRKKFHRPDSTCCFSTSTSAASCCRVAAMVCLLNKG